MQISRYNRNEIEDGKWDACVKAAINGHVFAQTWYLDIVSPEWEAVVLNDYDAVLPVPVKRSIIGKQLINPYWTPYLGIINKKPIDNKLILEMLMQIKVKHVCLVLNSYNKLPDFISALLKKRQIAVLDLIRPIQHIEVQFDGQLEKIINDYRHKRVSVVRSLDAGEYLAFVKRKNVISRERELDQLLPIMSFAIRYKNAGVYAAYDGHNEMMACAFFLKANNNLSLVHSADVDSDSCGVKAIVYHILKNNAGSNLTLDFPFNTKKLGKLFTSNRHHCMIYEKGLPRWVSLFTR